MTKLLFFLDEMTIRGAHMALVAGMELFVVMAVHLRAYGVKRLYHALKGQMPIHFLTSLLPYFTQSFKTYHPFPGHGLA